MSKLTLNISDETIARAKVYASENNRSLSAIIQSYLDKITLDKDTKDDLEEIKISSFVKSLSLKNTLPADYDYKKALGDYYSEKYK
ncbi:DUF6364 family protein [Flavobacterium psychrotrophum]|uniref:DUF6364 family protein n=1 Tax=Flavobacterium psychrotrophum TaxID=2294119 RepID=UPI000E31AC54|nr:DUF6364 family protein [Flavobacterium psychrotrophum]